MKIRMKVYLLVGLIVCFVPFMAFGQAKVDIKFMTGPMGGSWYPLGGAIAELIQKEIPGATVTVAPGGGMANVVGVEGGKADIGFGNSPTSADAVFGKAPFKAKANNVKQMANLYPQYYQMFVLEESGIKTVADLKGKVICPGPKGHTGELVSRQILEVYGLSYKDMSNVQHVSYTDAISLMKDGHAHAWLPGTTIPASAGLDLATTKKIRLLSVPDDKIKEMQKFNVGYLKRIIPKGTYPGVDYDVATIGYFTHMVVSAKLPDALVYQITKVLAENLDRLTQVVSAMKGVTVEDLALDIGVPFHPGAAKYYKEKGVMK